MARRLPNPNHFYRNAQSFNPFSTSSGGGGRGRGVGSPSPHVSFTARVLGQPDPAKSDSPPDETSFSSRLGRGSASAPPNHPPPPDSGLGRGHGRVIAPPSPPFRPSSFTSFGRGRAVTAEPRFTKDGAESAVPEHVKQSNSIPLNVAPAPGLGRGRPVQNQAQGQAPVQDVNRHMRPSLGGENRDVRPQRPGFGVPVDRKQAQPAPSSWKRTPPPLARPKMSREDAVKNAKSVLSRKNDDDDDERPRGSGRRARGGGRRSRRYDDDDDEYGGDKWDSVDGEFKDVDHDYDSEKEKEALIEMLSGPENYEAYQKIVAESMPDRSISEELIKAHDINCSLEFDREYHMEFNTNPDIEEGPPVPLRDVIEKARPFIMAHDGIQSHEEWEEAVEEEMKHAPLLKELVDSYSGPAIITAKKQGEELEIVAKTLPQGAPASVKRFTDRALLSLQSNPGWGFGKKAQFMDKLVREFSQPHKGMMLQYLNNMLDAAASRARLPSGQNPLQQLILIISDGLLHEKENLKRYVREMLSAKRMVAFLLLDPKETIVNTKAYTMVGVDGVQCERYLDSFPFPFYIVLKNIEALPRTLADLLRQWFELMQNSRD